MFKELGMMHARNAAVVVLLAVCGLVPACDSRKPAGTPAVAAAPAAKPVDWSKVTADGLERTMESFTHIARYADVWGKGAGSVRISFVGPSSVTDGAGHTGALTPEGWKGSVELVRKTGTSAIRAVPAGANNYRDGLGKVPRFAYTVTMDGETMVLQNVKALGDESNG
jgi:hypothetical protein